MCSVASKNKKKVQITKFLNQNSQNLQRQTLHMQCCPRKDEHLSKVALSYRPVLVSVKIVMMISLENRKVYNVLVWKLKSLQEKSVCWRIRKKFCPCVNHGSEIEKRLYFIQRHLELGEWVKTVKIWNWGKSVKNFYNKCQLVGLDNLQE